MPLTRQQIEDFLKGTCSKEEAGFIYGYLEQHPHELEAFLPAQEWEQAQGDRLPAALSAQLLENIRAGVVQKKQRVITLRRVTAAAAAILVLVLSGWLFLNRPAGNGHTALAKTISQPVLKQVANNGTGTRHIVLPDGSEVALDPYSAIAYYDSFTVDKRDISLTGRALFKVAKDGQRPFTVYAHEWATTALGTSFVVDANEAGKTTVRLLEGKVLVQQAQGDSSMLKATVLLPGQELLLDNNHQLVKLHDTHVAEPPLKKETLKPVTEDLAFDNASLKEVFDALEKKYDRKIQYNNNEVTGMYFTGTVLPTDSLRMVLKIVCTMNGLELSELPDDGYQVSKSN